MTRGDRDVGDLSAVEDFDNLLDHCFPQLATARSITGKATFLCHFGKFINRRQMRRRGSVHDEMPMSIEER
jgi:hypothetical protein